MYTKRPFQEHFYTFSLFVFPRILRTTINAAEYKNLPVSFHSIYGTGGVASAPIRICNEIGRPAFAMPLWRGQWSLVFPRNLFLFFATAIYKDFQFRIGLCASIPESPFSSPSVPTASGAQRKVRIGIFIRPLLFVETAVEVVKIGYSKRGRRIFESACCQDAPRRLTIKRPPTYSLPFPLLISYGKKRENIFESSSSNSSRTWFPSFFFRVAVASRIRIEGEMWMEKSIVRWMIVVATAVPIGRRVIQDFLYR